jgi:hypothetical protein
VGLELREVPGSVQRGSQEEEREEFWETGGGEYGALGSWVLEGDAEVFECGRSW